MGKKTKKKAAKAVAKATMQESVRVSPTPRPAAVVEQSCCCDAPVAGSDAEDLAADAACPASDGTAAAGSCCSCRQKETERSAALQVDVQKRLNRVIGQLNGIKSMVENNRYCGDVLIQLAASEAAVHRISEIILQDHMETCVVEQIRGGNVEVVDEAMKLIKKFM